jgi:hypothetical protein
MTAPELDPKVDPFVDPDSVDPSQRQAVTQQYHELLTAQASQPDKIFISGHELQHLDPNLIVLEEVTHEHPRVCAPHPFLPAKLTRGSSPGHSQRKSAQPSLLEAAASSPLSQAPFSPHHFIS